MRETFEYYVHMDDIPCEQDVIDDMKSGFDSGPEDFNEEMVIFKVTINVEEQ